MKADYMLIGVVIAAFFYLMGPQYHAFAIGGAALIVLAWFVSTMTTPKAESKKSKHLEPIVIESTRGAPYRIPAKMTLKFKPDESPDAPMWYDATDKGIIGGIGKAIGRGLRKLSGD
ncbi:hypothetical protein H0N95_02625 [Candidatus Micrarchaeota archaeon]|nr:hypothetical protein [Candidatus Micrarchaeota archaeon]